MKSYWQNTAKIPEFPRLSGDTSTDVLVIGGGMAGLLTAYCLQKRGIGVILAEKERICASTTAGTTAKITAQHGLIYQKILKSGTVGDAQMYYQANAEAVRNLKALCVEAGCGLESKDNFVYSFDRRKLDAEMRALQRMGVPALFQETLPIPVDAGAVGFADQGQFHPLLLAAFLAKNLEIYEHTKVKELVGTTAVTDFGRIRAEKIVVATHFPFLNKHGSYFLKLYQHRSYLLALKNAGQLPAMYVDDGSAGLSFSSFGDVLLLGGGGHRTGKSGGGFDELRAFRQQHYPQARECFHWAVQDTMSLDGIPYIGPYSKNTQNLYVAAGFNKWGMTGSMVSAQVISGLISGHEVEYAPVFSPSRNILKPQLFVNGFESAKGLLTPTTRRCPHLGCALHYNKEEHSWDCACHGSRFSEDGKVLNNPANGDWKPK